MVVDYKFNIVQEYMLTHQNCLPNFRLLATKSDKGGVNSFNSSRILS